jgi:hypothetical protein
MDMARADSFRTGSAAGTAAMPARSDMRLLTPAELADPAFRAAWDGLVNLAAEPNPFFEPWFLLPALEQWGASQRVVIKAWFHEGRLAGLMPILRSAKITATSSRMRPAGTIPMPFWGCRW